MDTILRTKVPVETYVDGFCASAATFLSVAASGRFMSRNSYMLIHQLSSTLWGKYSEIEDEKKNLDLMMETIKCSDCDNYLFITSFVLKKLSAIVSPNGQEALIPVQVYSCGNCGKVAEGMLEGSGVEEEKKSNSFPRLDI